MTLPDPDALFDVPADVAYFNTAFMGITPRAATAALAAAVPRKATPWTVPISAFFAEPDAARAAAARLLGGKAGDIALVPAVSYAMATAAAVLPLPAGGEVLVLAEEFPSTIDTWRHTAAARDGRLVTVARAAGQSWTEAVLAAITPKTAILALVHTHWLDGGMLDLPVIAAAGRVVGASLVLDLTQSLGALPFDLAAVDPDMAVAVGYKWMLGPYQVGYHYVAPRWQNADPIEQNWTNRAGADDFAKLTEYTDDYQPGARRFDVGQRSNFHTLPGAIVATSIVAELMGAGLTARLAALTGEVERRLGRFGFRAAPDRAPHYLALDVGSDAPGDLIKRLAAEKIFVSQRGRRIRVTPHLNIRPHDLDRLEAALQRVAA